MHATSATISINGAPTAASLLAIEGRTIVRSGSWLKVARIHDEVWQENPLTQPAGTVETIRTSGLGADLFTFSQLLPDITPRHAYHTSCDNLAVADTTNFTAWWDALPQESRKNVRKCQKRGVTIKPFTLDDALVRGIKGIYDETPIRQGRRFWHYGKDLATVQRENGSYVDRAQFIGAYLGDELIGFLKMVYVGRGARIMQILSKNAHYDKHPMNALLSAAVELCAQRPVDHLIYGQYVYGNKRNSSVTEFKRRNGFQEILLPRYYIPFTWRGSVAISSGLYRGLNELLPEPLINAALNARNFAYKRFPRAAA
ncbi:MAG: hypothetical protein V4773_07590 [Verrucomicrobiota bacterium]